MRYFFFILIVSALFGAAALDSAVPIVAVAADRTALLGSF